MDSDPRLTIIDTPFSPEAAAEVFRTGLDNAGAIVTFSGLVRRTNGSKETELELQYYPGFTERTILSYVEKVTAHWTLNDWRIIHRVGAMPPAEPIVFVATAARHRRDAFEAADCLMDMLKSRAPFWKKENNGDSAEWIEPREKDHDDAARWKEVFGE